MKKLINAVDDVVNEALRGVELSTPSVEVDHENRVVIRREKKASNKVALTLVVARATSRCTVASSARACWTLLSLATSSPPPLPIRFTQLRRLSRPTLACC